MTVKKNCGDNRKIHRQVSRLPQGCCDRGDNLTNQTIQVGVRRPLNVQVPAADVIDGLVVHHEGAVGVLQRGVSRQN